MAARCTREPLQFSVKVLVELIAESGSYALQGDREFGHFDRALASQAGNRCGLGVVGKSGRHEAVDAPAKIAFADVAHSNEMIDSFEKPLDSRLTELIESREVAKDRGNRRARAHRDVLGAGRAMAVEQKVNHRVDYGEAALLAPPSPPVARRRGINGVIQVGSGCHNEILTVQLSQYKMARRPLGV